MVGTPAGGASCVGGWDRLTELAAAVRVLAHSGDPMGEGYEVSCPVRRSPGSGEVGATKGEDG